MPPPKKKPITPSPSSFKNKTTMKGGSCNRDNGNKKLEVLQREYRNMEISRRAFAEESQLVLRKQQQQIEKLRKENEDMKSDIATLQHHSQYSHQVLAGTNTNNKANNSKNRRNFSTSKNNVLSSQNFNLGEQFFKSIHKLYSDRDKFLVKIQNEKNSIKEKEKLITNLQQTVWRQRKSMGGINAARDNQRLVEKQVRILENRLDQALTRFNKSIANNKKLRQEIDDLRNERATFENVYKKLEKELVAKKNQMAQIIEQSNDHYEYRDQAHLEIAQIEQANKKEQEAFEQQLQQMTNMLQSHLLKTLNSTSNTGNKRDDMEYIDTDHDTELQQDTDSIEHTDDNHNEFTEDYPIPSNAYTNNEPHNHDKKKNNQVNTTMITSPKKSNEDQRMQNFEEAFRKIAVATGISDVEDLVSTFIQNEEQHFSLFTYANEQADEIEKLQAQVSDLEKEEQMYKLSNANSIADDSSIDDPLSSSKSNQYERVLAELEEKTNTAKGQTEKLDSKCQDHQKEINGLKTGIQDLLQYLECTQPPPPLSKEEEEVKSNEEEDPLASSTSSTAGGMLVTEANMVHYLGVIEQRTNEIYSAYRHYFGSNDNDHITGNTNNNLKIIGARSNYDLIASRFSPSHRPLQANHRNLKHKKLNILNTITSSNFNASTSGIANNSSATATVLKTPSNKSNINILGVGPSAPMGSEPLFVNPPKLTDYSSSSDSDREEDEYDEDDYHNIDDDEDIMSGRRTPMSRSNNSRMNRHKRKGGGRGGSNHYHTTRPLTRDEIKRKTNLAIMK